MIDIQGLDELISEFERIEALTPKLKDEALIAGGDLLQKNMKESVYAYGLNRRSGTAQEAIIRTKPKKGALYVGTQGGKKQEGFYLYMHEFGYWNVRAGRFISPRPFASIAFENSKNGIMDKYAEVFRKGMGMK